MLSKRRPLFSGFSELSPSAKMLYLIRLALGAVVMVALFYGLMTLIGGVPNFIHAQQSRDSWLAGISLWNTYDFENYDIDAYLGGLPDVKRCGFRNEVTLSIRSDKLVSVKDRRTGEILPIGDTPCSYELFTVGGIFDMVRHSLDKYNVWQDYLGEMKINPAFGFVSQYSYQLCDTPTVNRLIASRFFEGCEDSVFMSFSRFRLYDPLGESALFQQGNP
jgi:hypothetical protein